MEMPLNTRNRLIITAVFSLYAVLLVLWDFTHGGVPIHYLFHSSEMPGISNWWGVLIIPIVSWISLKRLSVSNVDSQNAVATKSIGLGFLLAFAFGVAISLLFLLESNAIDYLMICLFLSGFFIPLFKSELYLGFVMSTLYMFGAVLPSLGGLIILAVLYLFYKIGRFVFNIIRPKN